MTEPLGVAVVGLGMAARPHALALRELSDRIEVRGAYARSREARVAFRDTYGFPVVECVDELLSDPDIKALILITPPNAREELVARFAAAGKHILSEKPLERSVEAAERVVATCAEAGVELGVVFQHRFRAASEALASKLAEGALGAIRIVRAEVPWWRDQTYYDQPGRGTYSRDGGGVLISQAIHTLDLMLALAGPVSSVQALCVTTPSHHMEAEDFAAGVLTFRSGAVGTLFSSTACYPGDAESLVLECDLASVRLKSGILEIRWRDGRADSIGSGSGTGGGADPMAFPYDWHKALLIDFADAVVQGRAPRVTGSEALKVHRLIAAVEESSRKGHRVDIPEG